MHFTEEENKTLRGAIDVWGRRSQLDMAIGEIGELLTLVGRQAQNRDTDEDWATEIADVMITVEQLAHMIGYEAVQEKKNYKMERLAIKVANARITEFSLPVDEAREPVEITGIDLGACQWEAK